MYNNNFLPSLTTSDLLTLVAPLSTASLSKSFFSKDFETLNGINSTSSAIDNSKSMNEESDHKLKFKLPGYEKSEIKISLENSSKAKNYTFLEPYGFLKVTVLAQNKEEGITRFNGYFPKSIDESTIEAKLNNGILTITAKTDPKKNKEKEIQIS